MQFSFTTDKIVPSNERNFDALDFAQLQNELMDAYESLDASVKELDAVQDVVDNVQSSLALLAKYGDSAIKQLNLDKGLEELLGVPEKLITAQKAVEGLTDAAADLGKKVFEGAKKFIAWVKDIFTRVFAWIGQTFTIIGQSIVNDFRRLTTPQKEAVMNAHPNQKSATEALNIVELRTNVIAPYKDVKALCDTIDMASAFIPDAVSTIVKNTDAMIGAIKEMLEKDPDGFMKQIRSSIDSVGNEMVKQSTAIVKYEYDSSSMANKVSVIWRPTGEDKTLRELGWDENTIIEFGKWMHTYGTKHARLQTIGAQIMDACNKFIIKLQETMEASSNADAKKFSAQIVNLMKLQLTMNVEMLKCQTDLSRVLKTHGQYFKGSINAAEKTAAKLG